MPIARKKEAVQPGQISTTSFLFGGGGVSPVPPPPPSPFPAFAEGNIPFGGGDGTLIQDDTFRLDILNKRIGFGVTNPLASLHLKQADATLRLEATNATQYSGSNLYDNLGNLVASFSYGNASAAVLANQVFVAARNATAPLVFLTNGITERMRITPAGRIGIGAADPDSILEVSSDAADWSYFSAFKNATTGYALVVRKGRGTRAARSAVLASDNLGYLVFDGWDSSVWGRGAYIESDAQENWTGSAHGANLFFVTTPLLSTTPVLRMTITSEGNLILTQHLQIPNAKTIDVLNASGAVRSLIQRFSDNAVYIDGNEVYFRVNDETSLITPWRITPSGHFVAPTDNTYDIGASGATRPRSLYLGSALSVGTTAQTGTANRFRMLQSMAQVYMSADQTITTATSTVLLFDTEEFDTDGLHSTVSNTGRLTAPIAGKYHVVGCADWEVVATNFRRALWIQRQDGVVYGSAENGAEAVTSGGIVRQVVSSFVLLGAGDYVQLLCYHERGSNLLIKATQRITTFSMAYVGE